jgi:hypothetical protein
MKLVSNISKFETIFTNMLQQWTNHYNIDLLVTRTYKSEEKPSIDSVL